MNVEILLKKKSKMLLFLKLMY